MNNPHQNARTTRLGRAEMIRRIIEDGQPVREVARAAWLTRRGLGRLTALEPKQSPRRYQRQHPGELIHLDIKKLARFERVGHRITGDRRNPSTGAG